MSETQQEQTQTPAPSSSEGVKLKGLFAFKEGMSTIYNDQGEAVPVTILRFDSWYVSQVKTKESDGYEAVQIARVSEKKKGNKASLGHLKAANVTSSNMVREIRQTSADVSVGQPVAIETLTKGDLVKITARSKGKGFQGSVRRWGFAGGPASHGSKFHRQPGSSGNRTWPGRVMPGKKFPGHLGDETVTVRNVEIVEVLPAENVLMVRGPVPGGRNTLVKLVRE